MKEPVLVIMAAGMGSRFGSLKQITPVDEQGHKIIDFSLYDAWKAGFRKVVFIIKHAIEEDFKAAVGTRMESYFEVRYVFQEVDRLPEGFSVPEGRTKPWGTGHAIACAAEAIDGPFAVLNADDYYGSQAMQTIYDFLKEDRAPNEHAMVGYLLRNTVTENGYVSRGVCSVRDGFLEDVTERVRIEKRGDDAAYTEDDGNTWVDLPGDTIVSMNLWGFQPEILPQFVSRFTDFLNTSLEGNPLKCEYYLPSVANAQLKENLGTIRVLTTPDVWHGVTYKEDLQNVRDAIGSMKSDGLYPEYLWMLSAAYHFNIDGAPFTLEPYGSGHINVTYLLTTTAGHRYILQRINSEIFDVDKLMENISSVLDHTARESNDPRGSMVLVRTETGDAYYHDDSGFYRVYEYVDGALCLQSAETADDFYQCAVAIGDFQKLLSNFPAEELHETIPNFHNTPDRYRIFREVLAKDPEKRCAGVQEEIQFVLDHEKDASFFQNMISAEELPIRVTHNDTKMNNVMLDEETRKALCVIDLDTVMPGLAAYDFGDSIRFGATTAAEDETDLSLVHLDLDLFRTFTRGFLRSCPNLTEKEILTLPMGAKIMTLECGVRFLTDYLDGDHYFTIHRKQHNLDRSRTQFKLVQEMESNWDALQDIVREEAKASGNL